MVTLRHAVVDVGVAVVLLLLVVALELPQAASTATSAANIAAGKIENNLFIRMFPIHFQRIPDTTLLRYTLQLKDQRTLKKV